MFGRARQWWWASRRRRRRITWLSVLLAVAGSTASLVLWMRDTGHESVAPPSRGPVQFYHEPKQVALTPTALNAARVTTFYFLRTAVVREHVESSYELIAPSLREGMSRAEWAKGDIPIIPYPVDLKDVRYQVDYSYASSPPDGLPLVGMSVSVRPRKGEQQPKMVFGIELEAAGKGAKRHWLVTAWAPRGVLGGEPPSGTQKKLAEPPKHGSLAAAWLLVPAGILAAIVLVPVGLGVRGWRRQRRVARDYRRTLEL